MSNQKMNWLLWTVYTSHIIVGCNAFSTFKNFASPVVFCQRKNQYPSFKTPFRVSRLENRNEKNNADFVILANEVNIDNNATKNENSTGDQKNNHDMNYSKDLSSEPQESYLEKSKKWFHTFFPSKNSMSKVYSEPLQHLKTFNDTNEQKILPHPIDIQNSSKHNTAKKISLNSTIVPRKTNRFEQNFASSTFKLNQTMTRQIINDRIYGVKKSMGKSSTSSSLFSSMDPNSIITVADLEKILNNNYVKVNDLKDFTATSSQKPSARVSSKRESFQSDEISTNQVGGIGIPQLSVLSTKEIKTASQFTTGILGLIVGTTLSPSLWLIGFLLGAFYGNKIATADNGNPTNIPFSSIILILSKQIAKYTLLLWDAIQGIWFMYKTGQLSYQYYKTYSSLDSKLKIQQKVDAWNARFIQGKQSFDAWEKENEVGRKILAGLRTVWLVEENTFKKLSRASKKNNKRSKYRIVNYLNEASSFCIKFAKACWSTLTRAPGHENDLSNFINGVRLSLSRVKFEIVSQRFGSGVAALVGINLLGALFTISPALLGFSAIAAGMMFPNWVAATYLKIQELGKQYSAIGRGEEVKMNNPAESKRISKRNNEHKYSYFLQENGKKKWYRTGNSIFKKK